MKMIRRALPLLLAFGICLLDQISKFWVRTYPVYTYIFHLEPALAGFHVQNPGLAFSLFESRPVIATVLQAVFIALLLIIMFLNRTSRKIILVMSCVLGGALGNLLDRVFFGTVTDFLLFPFFPAFIFNLADAAIVLGVTFLILFEFLDCLHGEDAQVNGEKKELSVSTKGDDLFGESML